MVDYNHHIWQYIYTQADLVSVCRRLCQGIWGIGLLSAPLNLIPWSAAARAMRARGNVQKVLETWISERSEKLDDTLHLGQKGSL